jgi:hypothetical protein
MQYRHGVSIWLKGKAIMASANGIICHRNNDSSSMANGGESWRLMAAQSAWLINLNGEMA